MKKVEETKVSPTLGFAFGRRPLVEGAAAHEAAAKCLEGGKGEAVCMKELQAACKNLAIGKYCGMKHAH